MSLTVKPRFRRVLLKLSGELLSGPEGFGIDQERCLDVARAIKTIVNHNIEVGIVIGGGNIFRGLQLIELGLQRSPADQMGMLATMLNGLALQQALLAIECNAKVMSALDCPKVVEPFHWVTAREHMSAGYPVIFVAGTGNPFFTTDTSAALRAREMDAEVILKATKVNGVYDKDPLKHPDAVKYEHISYSQVLAEKLQVMDATAIAMCRDGNIPILVFNMSKLTDTQILSVLSHENPGTLVTEG